MPVQNLILNIIPFETELAKTVKYNHNKKSEFVVQIVVQKKTTYRKNAVSG